MNNPLSLTIRELELPASFQREFIDYLSPESIQKRFPVTTVFNAVSGRRFQTEADFSKKPDIKYERYRTLLEDACRLLCESPTFNAALAAIPPLKTVAIGIKPLPKSYGVHEDRQVFVSECSADEATAPALMPLIISHEMRHEIQRRLPRLLYPASSLRDFVFVARIDESDACAFETLVAWELKERGHNAVWDRLLATPRYDMLAKAFADSAARDPAAVRSGVAANAVIEAWFNNYKLRRIYDTDATKAFLAKVKRQERMGQDGTLTNFTCRSEKNAFWHGAIAKGLLMIAEGDNGAVVRQPEYFNRQTVSMILSPANRAIHNWDSQIRAKEIESRLDRMTAAGKSQSSPRPV